MRRWKAIVRYFLRVFEGFWFFVDNIWMYPQSKGKVQPPREFSLLWVLEGKRWKNLYWFVAVWKVLFTMPGDFCWSIECKLSSFIVCKLRWWTKSGMLLCNIYELSFVSLSITAKSSFSKYDFVKMFRKLTKLDITESKLFLRHHSMCSLSKRDMILLVSSRDSWCSLT